MRLLEAYYVTTERESVNTVPFIPTNVYLKIIGSRTCQIMSNKDSGDTSHVQIKLKYIVMRAITP